MPILNFVWIGPPKFDQGGQDVIGPETCESNFKQYPENPRHLMVFWCQETYKNVYEAYFFHKGTLIKVISMTEGIAVAYRTASDEARKDLDKLLVIYSNLILDSKRNKIIDRVYMKDLFFNFILAYRGGYVLDTNIQALLDKPLFFPEYQQFMFPYIKDGEMKIPEVWMQYAPPNDLNRAKACFKFYLEEYKRDLTDIRPYSTEYYPKAGEIAASALFLKKSGWTYLSEWNKNFGLWHAEITGIYAKISELGVNKIYFNSHIPSIHRSLPHMYVVYINLAMLKFSLEHGVPVDNLAKIYNSESESESDYETALAFAVRSAPKNPKYFEVAEILLEHGANPNFAYMVIKKNGAQPELEKKINVTQKKRQMFFGNKNIDELLLNYGADSKSKIVSRL